MICPMKAAPPIKCLRQQCKFWSNYDLKDFLVNYHCDKGLTCILTDAKKLANELEIEAFHKKNQTEYEPKKVSVWLWGQRWTTN